MGKIAQYIFYLILVLIIVSYWKGGQQILGTFSSGVNSLINTLQGKNKDGNFSNYPS